MSSVQTVRGPVDTADLGKVLMHEHVFVLGEELRQNYPDYPEPWDEEVRVADAVAKLTEVKSRGISTIVDPTVIGLGRYIPRIVRINEQVDLNIIVATGIYTYNDIPFQFHYTGPGLLFDGPEPMVELFVKDIREGNRRNRCPSLLPEVRHRGAGPYPRRRAGHARGRTVAGGNGSADHRAHQSAH